MAREVKTGRIVFWLLILPLVIGFIGKWLFFSSPDSVELPYAKKQVVGHDVRVFVKPHTYYNDGHIDFEVTLESNENHVFLRQDPVQTVLLYLNSEDTPILPVSFTVSQKDAYHVQGMLNFKVSAYPTHIKLVLFDEEEYEFNWQTTR